MPPPVTNRPAAFFSRLAPDAVSSTTAQGGVAVQPQTGVKKQPQSARDVKAPHRQTDTTLQSAEQDAVVSAPEEALMTSGEDSAALQECMSTAPVCTAGTSSTACSRANSDSPSVGNLQAESSACVLFAGIASRHGCVCPVGTLLCAQPAAM